MKKYAAEQKRIIMDKMGMKVGHLPSPDSGEKSAPSSVATSSFLSWENEMEEEEKEKAKEAKKQKKMNPNPVMTIMMILIIKRMISLI